VIPQQVGAAVGHNPISILIPCHRVVGSTGKLTGYAGGLERKRALLELEQPSLFTAEQPGLATADGA
jgi:methylated-DNA-[protein]-cysteine S-methyltransferase